MSTLTISQEPGNTYRVTGNLTTAAPDGAFLKQPGA